MSVWLFYVAVYICRCFRCRTKFTDTSVFPVPPLPLSTAILILIASVPMKSGMNFIQQRKFSGDKGINIELWRKRRTFYIS